MRPTRVTSAVAAALALVGLAACAPATTDSSPQATVSVAPASATPTLPAAPEDPRPEVIWPLTGLDASDASAAELARPALSIKIENSAAARPQENLDQADVVFEEYVEAGISRLIAVYHSQMPDSVGPVRSMRPMDRNIMGSFAGPLVFSGAQNRFVTATVNSGQQVITQDIGSYGFYRTSGRRAPHNLHAYLDKILEQADDEMTTPPEQWAIAYPEETATAQVEGSDASSIQIHMSSYSNPSWRWDASKELWMRSEGSSPHVTMAGVQLSATNVVMLWVSVEYTSGNAKTSVPETLVAGRSGAGYVVSGDRMIPIEWSKAGQYEPFVLTTEAGDPVALMPGQTWFELIPNKGVGHPTSIDIS
ncbi:DUF3048 domain-containing protein [Demequina sp. SYSU T00039]|uniref:DUF3048 domain-containing protein n=1 Tax=Demequina lignilytica TaxID=3051663 RepID=A0AAW7M9E4_9MICO|nr:MULTISPECIES: DUF3048 domain-containing protein [unclassified Demequina]MDN4478025.1 DUF3048 domain-containing protein [Demequina sp. SYSU T00039-1]MDN4488525.1 DUF3048 domain-containing protein [Demequina sp. SYSU T00039]